MCEWVSFHCQICFESYHSSSFLCVEHIQFFGNWEEEKKCFELCTKPEEGTSNIKFFATCCSNKFLSDWQYLFYVQSYCEHVLRRSAITWQKQKLISCSWILERLGSWCRMASLTTPWCGLLDVFLPSWHRLTMGSCLREHPPPTTRPQGPCRAASFPILKVFFLT